MANGSTSSKQILEATNSTMNNWSDRVYKISRDRLREYALQVFDSKYESGIPTALIVGEALSKLSSVMPLPQQPMLDACVKTVTEIIEGLTKALDEFQNDVETDLKSMTKERLQEMRDKALADFNPETHNFAVRTQNLVAGYRSIIIENEATAQEVMEASVRSLCQKFRQKITKLLEESGPEIQESLKRTHKLFTVEEIIVELSNSFSNTVPQLRYAKLQQDLESQLDIIFEEELKSLDNKWSEESAAIRAHCNSYQESIDDARSTVMTLGQLREANAQIQDKLSKLFEQKFSKNGKGSDRLRQEMELIFGRAEAEFQTSISNPAKSATKFVAPSKSMAGLTLDSPLSGGPKIASISLGVHFGLAKLAANYWDAKTSSSISILNPQDNVVSFTRKDFKLNSDLNFTHVGHISECPIELKLWPHENTISSIPLLLVVLKILKRMAESERAEKVSNLVLALPSFVDSRSYEGIAMFGSIISVKLTLITETDAAAIHHFGDFRFKAPTRFMAQPALLVAVVRKKSFEIASYGLRHGQIVRYGLSCFFKNMSNLVKLMLTGWIPDQFVTAMNSVIESFPKQCRRDYKTVLLSDSRDLVNAGLHSKIAAMVPIPPEGEQCLSVSVAQGAALLAAFEGKTPERVIKYWGQIHPSYPMHLNTQPLSVEISKNVGLIAGWWVSAKEDEMKITQETTFAFDIMDRVCMPFKMKFKKYLEQQIQELNGMINISGFMRRRTMGILQENLDLISNLDVGKLYCESRMAMIENEVRKL